MPGKFPNIVKNMSNFFTACNIWLCQKACARLPAVAISLLSIKINGMYFPFLRVEDYPHALKKFGQMAEKLSLWKSMEPSPRNAKGKQF